MTRKALAIGLAAGTAWSALAGVAAAQDAMEPRKPLDKGVAPGFPGEGHRLIVKFRDEVRARAVGGRIVSELGVDMGLVTAGALGEGVRFEPLIRLPAARLAGLERRGAAVSGRAQPDLAGMMIVEAPEAELDRVARALHASPLTEWVYFQELTPPPPCEDILPFTPQYFPTRQGYHGAEPGMDMPAAWARGGRGQGVVIADCEYGYTPDHEDLCGIESEPGQTIHPNVYSFGWDQHGTAVFGEMIGLDNGYGVTGLAPDAQGKFFPEWTVEEGGRRVTAIANAIASVDEGDVVLLEMQTTGAGGGYGPAELDPAVWAVVRAGTDAGVVVVGAAGNGNQNLDSAAYAPYRDRGDSGAIIVGAGSSTTAHSKLSFSTYGQRVNVQGWGQNVFTTGYGNFAQHGGDINQAYTAGFSGTSSASPFIAAACASLQSIALDRRGYPLSPLELRGLLIETGRPQGSGGHIGPFPDMDASSAIVACTVDLNLDGMLDTRDVTAFLNAWSSGGRGADFNLDGAVNTIDVIEFLNGWTAGC